MLGKITREGEQARAVPKLEHPVEVKSSFTSWKNILIGCAI